MRSFTSVKAITLIKSNTTHVVGVNLESGANRRSKDNNYNLEIRRSDQSDMRPEADVVATPYLSDLSNTRAKINRPPGASAQSTGFKEYYNHSRIFHLIPPTR